MASIRTKFIVGLFVVIGVTIAIFSIIWLGMSHYLEKGDYYLAYFDESVQGLDKDSLVKYRGVTIGRVQSIEVAPDGNLIEVLIKIETQFTPDDKMFAKLKSVGITGIMFVEIERIKKGEENLSPQFKFKTKYPVIPTKSSEIKKLFEGINQLLAQIHSSDIKGAIESFKKAMAHIDQTVDQAEIGRVSKSLQLVLHETGKIVKSRNWLQTLDQFKKTGNYVEQAAKTMDKTVSRTDMILAKNEKALGEAIHGLKAMIQKADTLLEDGSRAVKTTGNSINSMRSDLLDTTTRLETAIDGLNSLAAKTSAQPSQLLFGEPAAPKSMEPFDKDMKSHEKNQ